jgi:hypothetical protein
MRTSSWRNSLADRRGVSAVEFALCVPIALVLLVGLCEMGRAWAQNLALHKGVEAGVRFAAQSALRLSGSALASAENLVKRGTLDASAPLLLDKWNDGGARLTFTTRAFSTGGVSGQVVRAEAAVPYAPIFPVSLPLLDFGEMRLSAAFEMVHVGN